MDLGGGIVGIVDPNQIDSDDYDQIDVSHRIVTCNRVGAICLKLTVVLDPLLKRSLTQIAQMMEHEFIERNLNETSYSQNDLQLLAMLRYPSTGRWAL